MNYQRVLAAWFTGILCILPLAEAAQMKGPATGLKAVKQGQLMGADTDVNELLFGGAGNGYLIASERKFAVTPKTEFLGANGGKTSLSSIKKGTMVKESFKRIHKASI